jgi:protein-S-isoprenylcysteine O-methyltransferase Ste14
MSKPSDDVPDLVVLPPVLVGGTLLLGLGLHYYIWSITLLPVVPARLAGVGIFIASGILAHTAQRAMQRVGTNILPTQPTLALALDGPYRRTRNPLYLAAIGVALGVSLWVDGLFPFVLLLPMSAILHFGIVLREEAYLLAKFGAQYEAYRKAVPRWL